MRKSEPIKKVTLANGETRYRFTIDVGEKPRTKAGKPVLDDAGRQVMMRDQRTHTYRTQKEAREERAKIVADRAKGTYIAATKKTLDEHLDEWLAGRRKLRKSTLENYRHALKPARDQLGTVELQKLTKAHVDQLIATMLTTGRRVGKKGTPLSVRTVALTLTVLTAALDDAMKQGILVRNVARLVEVDRPDGTKPSEKPTWTAAEAERFLEFVADDRLFLAWCMSLYGLRRGEVLGLRWCDIDLDAATLTVQVTRIVVEGKVIEEEPKTERGKRTLPLDAPMVATARRLKARQAAERLKAGSAYTKACAGCGEVHLFVDELGDPVHPESYSDRFEVLNRRAKLPKIRLHDTRHTCGTLMHLRGVPTAVISAWLGHASASFTMRVYVHSQDDELRKAGATLAGAYGKAM